MQPQERAQIDRRKWFNNMSHAMIATRQKQ